MELKVLLLENFHSCQCSLIDVIYRLIKLNGFLRQQMLTDQLEVYR